MKKRNFTTDRSSNKRVCECGGELEFLGVDYDFRTHVRCIAWGQEHIGVEGTKRVNDD